MKKDNYYVISKFKEHKIFHLHCSFHLGDNIFNLILFYNIKDYLEINDIKIIYCAKNEYLNQLQEFVCSKNITLKSLDNVYKYSIELWINNHFFNPNHDSVKKPCNYNRFYRNFFNDVLQKLNIKQTIYKLYYWDENLITKYKNLNDKYKNLDILIINSQPLSGQYNYDKNTWDKFINKLKNNFKIATTTKVNDSIACTFDDNLTVKDIGAISMKTKVIIAINSGVLPGILNYYTLINIRHVYIFDNRCIYTYPNFENRENITDIKLDELQNYINYINN